MQELTSKFGELLQTTPWLAPVLGVAGLLLVAFLSDLATRRILLRLIQRLTQKTQFTWDDELTRFIACSFFSNTEPVLWRRCCFWA